MYDFYFNKVGPKDPDPYLGAVDTSVLDAKFLPTTFAVQTGFANKATVPFYNLGTVAVTALPKDAAGKNQLLPSLAPIKVYDFPNLCTPAGTYDPRTDAYWRETQFAIFTGLPLATTSATAPPVIPVVQLYGVSGLSGNTCNDLKTADSITGGKFGAMPTDQVGYALRAVISSTATLAPLRPDSVFTVEGGWYRGLQLNYLDGGAVPTDAAGNLLPMEGVIVSYSATVPSKTTDSKVILLPKAPGEAGYSPIVRLHEFTDATKAVGTYTAICTAAPCAANEVDLAKATKVTNILFIAGSPN